LIDSGFAGVVRRALKRNIETFFGKNESVKREAGAYRAADQGPVACGFRRLPPVFRHDPLRALAIRDVRPEADVGPWSCGRLAPFQGKRRARVIVPDLDRIDLVPMAWLASLEQEIDAGACGAAGAVFVDPGLAIEPAFGMGREV